MLHLNRDRKWFSTNLALQSSSVALGILVTQTSIHLSTAAGHSRRHCCLERGTIDFSEPLLDKVRAVWWPFIHPVVSHLARRNLERRLGCSKRGKICPRGEINCSRCHCFKMYSTKGILKHWLLLLMTVVGNDLTVTVSWRDFLFSWKN